MFSYLLAFRLLKRKENRYLSAHKVWHRKGEELPIKTRILWRCHLFPAEGYIAGSSPPACIFEPYERRADELLITIAIYLPFELYVLGKGEKMRLLPLVTSSAIQVTKCL